MSHDFEPLHQFFPEVIEQLPVEFTSHEFIQKLGQSYQTLYIEALYAYCNASRPFMTVHGLLAKHLNRYPSLIERMEDRTSKTIFGDEQQCASWRRI